MTDNIQKIIEISELCHLSDPCLHWVIYINKDGKTVRRLLNGVSIWKFIKDKQNNAEEYGITEDNIEHFKTYDVEGYGKIRIRISRYEILKRHCCILF